MKVEVDLYIDVDGVLNIHSDSYRTYDNCWSRFFPFFGRMEGHLVRRLDYLCSKLNSANLFLISNWNLDDAKEELSRLGFSYSNRLTRPKKFLNLTAENRSVIVKENTPADSHRVAIVIDDALYKDWVDSARAYKITTDIAEGLTDRDIKLILERVESIESISKETK